MRSSESILFYQRAKELRYSYQSFGPAQGFFATYGFIEASHQVHGTEVRLQPWDGPGEGFILRLSVVRSLRRLLSRFRVKAAIGEERQYLERDPELVARFPLSYRCRKPHLIVGK